MTLTTVATITRRFIFIFGISAILGVISLIGYRIWYNHYLNSLPPVEEKPDLRFGTLPPPDLPSVAISSSNFSYSLDTTTGGLPATEKIVKVFFVPKAYATFLSGDKSRDLARKFGISSDPEVISETQYRYQAETKNLIIDLDTGNFKYTNTATRSAALASSQNNDQFIQEFKNFLNSLGLLKTELAEGAGKVLLQGIEGTSAGTSLVSLWPQDIDQKPIITPLFNQSLIKATVADSPLEMEDYLSLDYTFWPVDLTSYATYESKTSQQAFEDLKSSKGTILMTPAKPQVSITSAHLAYFESENYSPYLQPVFIFEGPGFVGIVPAIREEFIDQTTGSSGMPTQ